MAEYELTIAKNGDELEVSLTNENPQGDAQQGTQKQRRAFDPGGAGSKPRNQRIREAKDERRVDHAKHIDLVGPHVPMIVRDLPGGPANNDTVTWTSDHEFMVDVEIDDGYSKAKGFPNPPRSIFVNTVTGQNFSEMPQKSQQVAANVHQVTGRVVKGTQAPDHLFYKMTIWSQGLKLDPDFFCDR
jgi:hypothetical protein